MFGSHEKPQHETFDEESTSSSSSNSSRVAIIGLVLVMVAALGWFALETMGSDNNEAEAVNCETTVVTVAAAPAMAELVEMAADSLADNGQCIEVEVVAASVADIDTAQDEASEGDPDVLPDLWVPDSPAWARVLTEGGRDGKVLAPSLASTPVGFASGRDGATPASWLEVLNSDKRLVMSDPKVSGASAMALLAPFAEGDSSSAETAIVPVAQQFGDDVASGTPSTDNIDNLAAGSDLLIPVTERDFLIAQRGNESLVWVAPKTGVALLNFPLVQPSAEGQETNASGQALDVAGRTGERLADWFTSGDGIAEVAKAMLRGSDGGVLADYASLSLEEQLPTVEKVQVDAVMKSWNSLTVPSSILALVETSDSMGQTFGTETRIQLAVDASKTALAVFPDAVRLGLRQFGTGLGPDGEDWVELAPLRRLDAKVNDKGETQIDLITRQADSLPPRTGGGSGLYDSILAGYQETTRQYNPYYSNAMVVFADGPNDDPDSISLGELKRELKALYNPERPVRIIIIALAVSDSADFETLQSIASTAEGSGAYQVLKPDEILTVLAQNLLSRE